MKINTTHNKIFFLLLMICYGCMGPIVEKTGLPAGLLALVRAVIAFVLLLLFLVFRTQKTDKTELKKCLLPMVASGAFLAGDWVFLFLAYEHTTVATATVIYYIVPVLVLLGSFFFLGEKIKIRHGICMLFAFGGEVLVSGIIGGGFCLSDMTGPIFALCSALCYASIILVNKKFPHGDTIVRTVIQIGVAAVCTAPYALLATDFSTVTLTAESVFYTLLLSVVLTAAAYVCYFSLIVKIPAKTTAFFSYADPVTAVLVSVFVMGEPITALAVVGTVMVIGSAIISEI